MPTDFEVVVPVLHLSATNGEFDYGTTRRYAERAASTWVDRFIVSGSTTRGDLLTIGQRAEILDLWLEVAPPQRLLACCWEPGDFTQAAARGIAPMAVMRGLGDHADAVEYLRTLPQDAYIYSHPMFGRAVFDASLAAAARERGSLPRGGKLAKISHREITNVRRAAGAGFSLWDGSSRRIQESIDAGASGVVATPLCAFDLELPEREVSVVQRFVDPIQTALDALPDRAAKTSELVLRADSRGSLSRQPTSSPR